MAWGELTDATVDIPPGIEIEEELTSDFETEFYVDIGGDIQGSEYRFFICMKSTSSRQGYADIVLNPGNEETILASTSFTVDSGDGRGYEATVSGLDPDIPSGGTLALRLKSDTTGSEVFFVFSSNCISFIETPSIDD